MSFRVSETELQRWHDTGLIAGFAPVTTIDPNLEVAAEKEFQREVIRLATTNGWRVFHPTISRKSVAGWPDLVLVRERLLIWELKTETGNPTAAQLTWLEALQAAGVDARLTRPRDWVEIKGILEGGAEKLRTYRHPADVPAVCEAEEEAEKGESIVTPEVKAAAERFINSGGFGCSHPEECVDDLHLLATAFIAENPADDEEPITVEWLESVGFQPEPGALRLITDFGPIVVYIASANELVWSFGRMELGYRRTRGHVRRLVAALGGTLKETP